jgi:hypothetical protein
MRYWAILILLVAGSAFGEVHYRIEGGPPAPSMQSRPDCESIGYVHAWEDTTPNASYTIYCPGDPDCGSPNRSRACLNCGKRQVKPKPTPHLWEDVR